MVRGKGVSNGIALAEQFLVDAELTPRYEEARDKSAELKMLRAGREMAAEELQSTIREAASEFGQKEHGPVNVREPHVGISGRIAARLLLRRVGILDM